MAPSELARGIGVDSGRRLRVLPALRLLALSTALLVTLCACSDAGGGAADGRDADRAADRTDPPTPFVPVTAASLPTLLQTGTAPGCTPFNDDDLVAHDSYRCASDDGYAFELHRPRSTPDQVVVVLHPAGWSAADMRAFLTANTELETLSRRLLLLPQARAYAPFGTLLGQRQRLWNGSGLRSAGDNGCCVDNGLDDRRYISALFATLATALPQTPRFLIGISNGGMLAIDLMRHAGLDIDEVILVVSSDQTGLEITVAPPPAITWVGVRDDEIVPFSGGPIEDVDLLRTINADNGQVIAPSFIETRDTLLGWKNCSPTPERSTSHFGEVADYACAHGTLQEVVLPTGGHRLAGELPSTPTPLRRALIVHALDRFDAHPLNEHD